MRQPETRAYPPPASRPTADAAMESQIDQERPIGEPSPPIEPILSGVDADGLRQYHLALGKTARQFRRYPEEADAAGWNGRVTMRLAVSETGSPLGISLLDSSSFAILDQAALDMMLLAASHTEIPESLRGHAFTIDLTVDYTPEVAP
jgi:protein TonB